MSRQRGARTFAAGIVSLVAIACNAAVDSTVTAPEFGAVESGGPASSAQASASPIPDTPTPESPDVEPTTSWRNDAWASAAPMPRPRSGFDAVILGDGTVLVVGDDHDCAPGGASPGSELADIYDPSLDVWHEAQPLNKPRKNATMVTLPDGSAMVIGGVNRDEIPFSSTKILSPESGTWRDGPLLT